MRTNWLKVYLWRRAVKNKDKVLIEILSKPWDGKLESLPHFRGCQTFRGSQGFGEFKCDCGISSVAAHEKMWFLTLFRSRYRSYAKYLRLFVHPVRLFRSLKDGNRTRLYFRELARQVAEGIHSARGLFLVSPPSPNPELRDERLRQILVEQGIVGVPQTQGQTKKRGVERS